MEPGTFLVERAWCALWANSRRRTAKRYPGARPLLKPVSATACPWTPIGEQSWAPNHTLGVTRECIYANLR